MRGMINWWKKRGGFIPCGGLCLILLGIQAAICTTLNNEMPYREMLGIYSVVSLLLVFLVILPERWLWKVFLLLLAVMGILVWKNRWDIDILEHAEVLAYDINEKYQAYMNQNLFPGEWCIEAELSYNMALICFCILMGIYIAWSSLKLHSKLLMSMPVILVYCGALLLGVTPGKLPTLLLIIGMAMEMQWITERQKMRNSLKLRVRTERLGSGKRTCIVVFILVAGLSISWHLSSRISGRVFQNVNRIQIRQHRMEQDLKVMVQTRGQQLRGLLGIDSGGYLSNVAPKYLNKPVFTVAVSGKPKGSMYLRGFVGDIYQGGKWKASKNIQKESGKRKRGIWRGKFCQSQYTDFDSTELDVEIRYTRLGKKSKYLYTPYSKSGAINKMNREEQSLCAGGEDDYLSLYQNLAEEMPEPDDYFGVSDELIMDVQNVLWRNASYSLELDPLPRNQDYAEYFLFYSQKGYCEHFATAGTLILRNMYHAARYVSGYRIPSSRFTYNKEDGTYTAEVLDSDAHAWSEVWVDRDYWMPQEMTPSGEDSELSQGAMDMVNDSDEPDIDMQELAEQTAEPSETEPAEEAEETEVPSPDPESEASKDDPTGDSGFGLESGGQTDWKIGKWWESLTGRQKILLVVSVIVICILIFAYLCYQGRKRRSLQRMAQMRERNRPAYIRMRLGIFLERLHRSGVAVKINMPEQQWLQVLSEELQEQTDPEEMETVAELVRRAAYSREMVTETEVDWFDAYCDRIEGSLTRKFSIFRNKRLKGKRK